MLGCVSDCSVCSLSSVCSLGGRFEETVDCVGVALLVHDSLEVYVSVCVILSRVLNPEGYSSAVLLVRDSVYDSEFSLSEEPSEL